MPSQSRDEPAGATASKNSKTFEYTGKEASFVVPAGVTQLNVVARGGQGGGLVYYPSSNTPGFPGRVYAVIPVQPREKLYIYVGGSGAHGGFNGGGSGGNIGGGASDVRDNKGALADRIIVAAGGGGAGIAIYTYGSGYGGKGGGLTGKAGGGGDDQYDGEGGTGATQSTGGSGGPAGYGSGNRAYDGQPGNDGASGAGGSGGAGAGPSFGYAGAGGGGGGGYYGGGGGGGGGLEYYFSRYESSQGGGGGGGSSYVEPNAIKSRLWTGWKKNKGDGLVVLSW